MEDEKIDVSSVIKIIDALNDHCGHSHHSCDCNNNSGCNCNKPANPDKPENPDKPNDPITDEEKEQLKEYLEKYIAEKLETLSCILIPRHDTSSNWGINDPVLENGEYGVEDDTHRVKRGDGKTPWTELPYETFGIEKMLTADAKNVNFDNTISQLSKFDVQSVLDYLIEEVKNVNKELEKKESSSNLAQDFTDKSSVTKYPSLKAVSDLVDGVVDDFADKIKEIEDNINNGGTTTDPENPSDTTIADIQKQIDELRQEIQGKPSISGIPTQPTTGNFVLTSKDGVLSWESLTKSIKEEGIYFEQIDATSTLSGDISFEEI